MEYRVGHVSLPRVFLVVYTSAVMQPKIVADQTQPLCPSLIFQQDSTLKFKNTFAGAFALLFFRDTMLGN